MTQIELLQTYNQNAQAFITAAQSIPESLLNVSPAPGEWSAAYVIHHMADSEIQFAGRYANTLAEDQPTIVPFDEEKFPTALHYEKRSVANSISAFSATHNLSYENLKNAAPEAWSRISIHQESGPVELISLVKLCSGHISNHIQQLQNLIK